MIVFISTLLSYGLVCYGQKEVRAVKIRTAIHIDGTLDEEAWASASPATGFITSSPSYGMPASDSTEVRILYDNTAIYVGAILYCKPSEIRKQFTPRDQERNANVDHFAVFIDSYKDRQNAFQFLVTSRNVQTDARISAAVVPANGIYGDISWDAVWDSKVSMRPDGWSVEIRIPLFSLRFSNKKIDEWGIQFMRFARRVNESSFWSPVNPNTSGFVNQFGDLGGLENIEPPLRLSFSPYLSGGYRGTPYLNDQYKSEWLKSGGMDVKYGVSEGFTLDATLIPDLGQVI
ncbi:MAG: carbohydrate binding family 9 domain-containing protein, partial [Chitinophagaceae bacterium]|nr:carbohydrate binding family 9 domain-containing protein [Chitinophagaceae bacterium]